MRSISNTLLLCWLATATAQRHLQVVQTPVVNACQGQELEMITQGCDTPQHCQEAAESMGLQIGSDEWPFEGEWADKGCIFYPPDHELYPNQAYFGQGGTCSQLKMTPMAGAVRMSCNGSTRPPFDPMRCQGENLCRTADDCRAAALANNYQLGNDLDSFEGDYHVKGCVFYPEDHEEYPGQAFWGSGASICGQLRADPRDYDGSVRMSCGAGIVEEGEVNVPRPITSSPTFDVAPARPVQNLTEPVANVTESDVEKEDPFFGPEPVVSMYEGNELSAGVAMFRTALVSSGFVAAATLWAMM